MPQRKVGGHTVLYQGLTSGSIGVTASQKREELMMILNQNIQPEAIVDAMLSSEASWNATSIFAAAVLIDLRSIERRRANDAN
ncbi:hypothetical protein EVAR_47085_1 [Eumeta japonica]|uniref:Uncharacterized protein n=1 Tax=Eumeta variegata TaxID=151549 RepID=A0A4C1YDH0_EUMVA|nr:hypothetical protein EVAR_47085_1 [Eumeta japonica]